MHNAHAISADDLLIIVPFFFSSIFDIDGKQEAQVYVYVKCQCMYAFYYQMNNRAYHEI